MREIKFMAWDEEKVLGDEKMNTYVCEHGSLKRKCYICYLEEEVERLKKAISVSIDRMKEGGPGTRSFVYETLKNVLEGEK